MNLKKISFFVFILIILGSTSGCSVWKSEIKSEPQGSKVFFNGNYIGTTPFKHEFTEHAGTVGTHTLLFKMKDYEDGYYVIHDRPSLNIISSDEYPPEIFMRLKKASSPESAASPSASAMPVGSGNILGINVGPTRGPRGVTVITVVPGSPCASVLNPGDNIYTFDLIDQNGSRVGHQRKINANNFQEEVSKIQPGITVKISLGPFKYVNCFIPTAAK